MDIAINNLTVKTVPSNYSWDKSNPTENTVVNAVLSGNRYIGYAPFTSVLLSSFVDNVSGSGIAYVITADYQDYYNSQTSTQTSLVSGFQTFCHNYIMPGVYSLNYNQTQYIAIDNAKCELGVFNPYETYVEKDDSKTKRLPFSWMWYNFFKEDYEPRTELVGSFEPRNEFLTWEECVFQGPKQVTWDEASGPAIEIRNSPVSWQWKKVKAIPNPIEAFTHTTKWSETRPSSLFPRTWKQINAYKCKGIDQTETIDCLELVPRLSSISFLKSLPQFIEIQEIPPQAYIEVIHTQPLQSRISPYKIRLSPKFVRCGSFPIEKLLWDFGNNNGIVEVSRNGTISNGDVKLLYQNSFSLDYTDPRNYDVEFYYTRISSNNCFYPSLTAVASSTGTIDCTTAVVGPIKFTQHASSKFVLKQNYLSDRGIAYAGAVNDTAAFWNRHK